MSKMKKEPLQAAYNQMLAEAKPSPRRKGGEAPASRGAGRATASLVRKFDQDYDVDESGSEVDDGDESEAEGLSEGLVREQGTVNKPLAHKVPGENVLVI